VCPARYEKIAHDGGVWKNYELKASGRGLPITQRSGGATIEPPVIGKASDRACSRTGRLLRTSAQVLTTAAHVNFTNGNRGKFDLASLHGWSFLHDCRVASSHPGERPVTYDRCAPSSPTADSGCAPISDYRSRKSE
jgi:hypothetical protein